MGGDAQELVKPSGSFARNAARLLGCISPIDLEGEACCCRLAYSRTQFEARDQIVTAVLAPVRALQPSRDLVPSPSQKSN